MLKDNKNTHPLTIVAGTFSSLKEAEAGYGSAKEVLHDGTMTHTFAAAILSKTANGKIKVLDKHEEGVKQGALSGALVGILGGLVVALFPAVGIGAMLAGMGFGAGIGAFAGHVVTGMSRKDLADIGEILDQGEYALVIATDWTDNDRITIPFRDATATTQHSMAADMESISVDLAEAKNSVHENELVNA